MIQLILTHVISVVVTYPLDLTKTRLQIQGEGGAVSAQHRGMITTAFGIGQFNGLVCN